MALVPLGNYVFFLAQLQTFGYVAVYFGALIWRYRSARHQQPMQQSSHAFKAFTSSLHAAAGHVSQSSCFIGQALSQRPCWTHPRNSSSSLVHWRLLLRFWDSLELQSFQVSCSCTACRGKAHFIVCSPCMCQVHGTCYQLCPVCKELGIAACCDNCEVYLHVFCA